jgi:hypothetical protein
LQSGLYLNCRLLAHRHTDIHHACTRVHAHIQIHIFFTTSSEPVGVRVCSFACVCCLPQAPCELHCLFAPQCTVCIFPSEAVLHACSAQSVIDKVHTTHAHTPALPRAHLSGLLQHDGALLRPLLVYEVCVLPRGPVGSPACNALCRHHPVYQVQLFLKREYT